MSADDLGLSPERAILIDHHCERAGIDRPTALHQAFELLSLPKKRWNRWFDLVAAKDRGYVPALVQAGATREEIIELRRADQRAQGITEGGRMPAREGEKARVQKPCDRRRGDLRP